MSDSPPPGQLNTLSKMDALLKKHRGGSADTHDTPAAPAPAAPTEAAPPPDAWLPVLTKVIERGTPPVVPPATASPEFVPPAPALTPAEHEAPPPAAATSAVSDTLTEQLMSELAPRLSEVMEKQVAAELRKNLDQTVASLLNQLDVNVREIVRDAVAEKLKKPHDPAA
ncbi:MAG: hypothetical protein H6R09_1366 [Proteobacteria bacterium]|nr:hypothetical protein [Pseudomonadota bacterium]